MQIVGDGNGVGGEQRREAFNGGLTTKHTSIAWRNGYGVVDGEKQQA